MTLGDRIVVMAKGIIQQADTPMRVYREPANRFVAGFIGTPPMNFIDGKLVRENAGVAFAPMKDGETADAPTTAGRLMMDQARAESLIVHVGSPLVLGLRPHTLHLDAAPANAPARAPLRAVVRTVEPLGDSMDVSATLETGQRVVARVTAREGVVPDERILFHVDMTQAHVFEPGEFGARL